MKKITLFLLAVILTVTVFAQNSGRGFSYQAVARDANGAIRKNEPIEIRFSLLRSSSTGATDWIEEHTINTDIYGTFSVIVGTGIRDANSTYANFSDLNFEYSYWLKTEIKDGGTYTVLSNQALLSVPYAENTGMPIGTVVPFFGTVAPLGWLMCDGSLISRTTYSRLFNVISTRNGYTNSTNFRVPDLRGRFIRGASGSTSNDPDKNSRIAQNSGGATGNNIGSLQNDATARPNSNFTATGSTSANGNHRHVWSMKWYHTRGGGSGNWYSPRSYGASDAISNSNSSYSGNHAHSVSTTVNGGGDNETRPTNIYANYIIKY